jgi:hypothetical protein
MVYGIAIIAIQVMTLIHVVRTGRTQPWLFVVLFLPLVGSIAYLIAEVLPEVLNGKTAREAAEIAKDRLDPDRHVRLLLEQAKEAQTPEAYAKLAHEYARLGRHRDAVSAYGQATEGFFADDPDLNYAMTQAAFDGAEEGTLTWRDARTAFEKLATIDPKFRPKERSLFLARLAQAEGDTATAEREYAILTEGYSSIETRVRYAHFLFNNNRRDEARSILESVQRESAKAAPHVTAMNQKWFDQARTALDIVNRAGTNR